MDKIRIAIAGMGAFGMNHFNGLKNIDNAEVTAFIVRDAAKVRQFAEENNIRKVYENLDDALASPEIDALILSTPTALHARQAIACLKAGKHVEVEIPMCDKLSEGEELVRLQELTGLVAMAGHTRRFNPPHQYIRSLIDRGEFSLQQMNVQTYFFRRTNINAAGQPRSWTDSLLWHHSAHTIDLFAYQSMGNVVASNALQGPISDALGIPLDMSIQLKSSSGAVCTLSLSFNNEGPIGTNFRYIGDTGTYLTRYDDLYNGGDEKIDLSGFCISDNGIELQDREFVAAIMENREPNASVRQVLPCYQVIGKLERELARQE